MADIIKTSIKGNICLRCQCKLTDDNSREVSTRWNITGRSFYCIDCEEAYLHELAQTEGISLALFHCCAAFNVPLFPIVLDGIDISTEPTPWITYINKLEESGKSQKGGHPASFFDGVTNILCIFGRKMSQTDFGAYIKYERERLKDLPGTEEQRERWGTESGYTSAQYDELDRSYSIRIDSYKGQTITPQMDDTLRRVCKANMKLDELLRADNFQAAQALSKMIDTWLAAENMRKKDEKPVETFRMDALIDNLEKSEYMKDGKFLSYDEMAKVIASKLTAKKYTQSLDAADQILLNVINNARKNADQPTLYELPTDMAITDEFGEFAPKESEEEKENKRYAKLTPVRFEKKISKKKRSEE